ncbi:hypothetical protein [Marinobacter sp. ELB17]|uniref:hypothetical protein n=1 Tax=Marinobacter sp. ELB17 TaxID=270374 RepID=UPI0000F36183|nr:hypothetical protein [Marinobacter sp. ELB17]EAZ97692.1 hypothetical protein MELB17_24207 [Marinobacter sp. ELB17]
MALTTKPEPLPRVMDARAKLSKLASTQKLGKAAGLAAELMLGKKKLSTQEGIATAARRYKVAKPLIEGLLGWYLEARHTVDVVIPAPSSLVSLSHSPVLPDYDCPHRESVTVSTAGPSAPQRPEPSVLDAQSKLQALAVAGHWALAMVYEKKLSMVAATQYAAKRYGVLGRSEMAVNQWITVLTTRSG